MKVLIVEDDEALRRSAARMLRLDGFQVVEAGTADEACTRFLDHTPDLLFTDIHLPGTLDGWDVAEACRKRNPRLPVIYTTASWGERPRPVPGSVMLEKPYSRQELMEAIRSVKAGPA